MSSIIYYWKKILNWEEEHSTESIHFIQYLSYNYNYNYIVITAIALSNLQGDYKNQSNNKQFNNYYGSINNIIITIMHRFVA